MSRRKIQLFLISIILIVNSGYAITNQNSDKNNMRIESPTKETANKNLKNSQEFLDQNKNKNGINTLPSGLQYKIIKEGKGNPPEPNDFVTVRYRGMLLDGTEFENTFKQKEAPTFEVNAVIPGWTEALQMMKPGSKWTIYIPPNLAYGEQGAGKKIPPNSLLIFDVELLAIRPSRDLNQDNNVDEWEDLD